MAKTTQSRKGGNNAKQDKPMAVIGYIVPILFFVPFLTEGKASAFARFHANQQLNLLLFWILTHVAVWLFAFLLIPLILLPIVYLLGIVLAIAGVVNAVNGDKKPLPLIGEFKLIQ